MSSRSAVEKQKICGCGGFHSFNVDIPIWGIYPVHKDYFSLWYHIAHESSIRKQQPFQYYDYYKRVVQYSSTPQSAWLPQFQADRESMSVSM
jgi:hypothetical protein